MYDAIFRHAPNAYLVVSPDGAIRDMNLCCARRLNVAEAPPSIFDLFNDSTGRLRRDLLLAAGSSCRNPSAANIATGDLAGLKQEMSLSRLSVDDEANVLVWLREGDTNAFRSHTDLIRRLNRELTRKFAYEEELRTRLDREHYLRAELVHRVKNNLAVLATLTRLRMSESDEAARSALREIELRIRSIALVHDLLDRAKTVEMVDVGDLIGELGRLMRESLVPETVSLHVEADSIKIHNEDATVLCLLINELVTNTLKHAFTPDVRGRIDLVFRRNGVEKMELRVRDDGRGMPDGGGGDGSRGMRILQALAGQLEGELHHRSNAGTEWTLVFEPRAASELAAE